LSSPTMAGTDNGKLPVTYDESPPARFTPQPLLADPSRRWWTHER
jgi:hypothetical protein